MKIIFLFLFFLPVFAQETNVLDDLAIVLPPVTPYRGITLVKHTEREDFLKFKVTIDSLKPNTNRTVLSITNDLLTLESFAGIPSGPVRMEVRSVFWDGQISEPSFFRFSIWRGAPPKPGAHSTALSWKTNLTDRVNRNTLSGIRSSPTNRFASPVRFDSTNAPPLPGGLSDTYADKQDAVAEEMIKHYKKSGRRSQ